MWLCGMVDEEEKGHYGPGDKWCLFVRLIQAIWEQDSIPRQIQWVIVVFCCPREAGTSVVLDCCNRSGRVECVDEQAIPSE